MRSLLIVLLLVGVSHGSFLDSLSQLANNIGNQFQTVGNQIGQGVTNLWNGITGHVNNAVGNVANAANNVIGNVVDSAGNIYGQLVNTANGVVFASNFLWDNIFGPAYDLLIEGGQLFLDDKFGNIVSSIGRRSANVPNALSEKYDELTARFKANLHSLYEQLFEIEKQALDAVKKGENTFSASIRAFHDKIATIHEQINTLAADLKRELKMHALTVGGDWVNILDQYTANIDVSVKTMHTMFQQLAQDLMQNLVEVAASIIPDAYTIIESLKQQGLLSFLKN